MVTIGQTVAARPAPHDATSFSVTLSFGAHLGARVYKVIAPAGRRPGIPVPALGQAVAGGRNWSLSA